MKCYVKTQKHVFPIKEYTQTTTRFRDRINPCKICTKKTVAELCFPKNKSVSMQWAAEKLSVQKGFNGLQHLTHKYPLRNVCCNPKLDLAQLRNVCQHPLKGYEKLLKWEHKSKRTPQQVSTKPCSKLQGSLRHWRERPIFRLKPFQCILVSSMTK